MCCEWAPRDGLTEVACRPLAEEGVNNREVAASFVLPDQPVHVEVGGDEAGNAKLVAVTEGGAMHCFSHHINGWVWQLNNSFYKLVTSLVCFIINASWVLQINMSSNYKLKILYSCNMGLCNTWDAFDHKLFKRKSSELNLFIRSDFHNFLYYIYVFFLNLTRTGTLSCFSQSQKIPSF